MRLSFSILAAVLVTVNSSFGADRINHEGRILGPVPVVSSPILFNTPEADAVLGSMQILPLDNPWNEDISRRPTLPNSDQMIAQVMADLGVNRQSLRLFHEMNFVLVPGNQPSVPITFFNWPEQSDPGPWPIPAEMPVETWPRETGSLTLEEWQRDVNDDGGDRHSIIVQPESGYIWETWLAKLTNNGWEASNGARFNLNSNALRPMGWTSGDAAGFPMFPALVRFDECERGMVEHAMRLVVKRTRLGPIYPATHNASVGNLTNPNIPAMGQRFRLKQDFVVPANFTKYERAVIAGLKKYGAMVADNGNFFSISVTPDQRYPANAFSHMSSISITNFEVIQTTGPTEGPRSPGAPRADAGGNFSAPLNIPVPLKGSVLFTNHGQLKVQWKVYSGPGEAVFSDSSKTNSEVTFSAAGEYILMLSGTDDIHTPSYSTVHVQVTPGLTIQYSRAGNLLQLSWSGGTGPFEIQSSESLKVDWETVASIWTNSYQIQMMEDHRFFRVQTAD